MVRDYSKTPIQDRIKVIQYLTIIFKFKVGEYWKALINFKTIQEGRRPSEEFFELCGKSCGIEYTNSKALKLS